jgi:hypothetical protein
VVPRISEDDEGDTFLWNVWKHPVTHHLPEKQRSSIASLWWPENFELYVNFQVFGVGIVSSGIWVVIYCFVGEQMVQRNMLSPCSLFKDNIQVWHGVNLAVIFDPWRQRQHFSAKHCHSLTWHGVMSSGKQSFGCLIWCQLPSVWLVNMKQVHPHFRYAQCVTVLEQSSEYTVYLQGVKYWLPSFKCCFWCLQGMMNWTT